MHQIYDRIFKKILTLSSKAVINLINGLFETDYPPDSTLSYHWTEFHDDGLKKTLADAIIGVNGTKHYHMEAQMTEDQEIVFRVFEYGYRHAELNRNDSGKRRGVKNDNGTDNSVEKEGSINDSGSGNGIGDRNIREDGAESVLVFPEPKIIYLYTRGKAPERYRLTLDFGTQGTFRYEVPTFQYLETSVEELNRRKMVILIPFELLKLRDRLEKSHTEEDIAELKSVFEDDILESIRKNLAWGNIEERDAVMLRQLTQMLFRHICKGITEVPEVEEMDQSIVFEWEKYWDEMEEMKAEIAKKREEIAQQQDEIAQRQTEIAQQQVEIAQQQAEIAKLSEYKEKAQQTELELQAEIAENIRLRKELEQLKKN